MPSPFDEPAHERRRRHHHRRPQPRAVERAPAVKPDWLVLGLWIALFVLFAIGAIAALLR